MKVAILTSGGDAPGMNAAIRAATLLLLNQGVEAVGVHLGYKGLISGDFQHLEKSDVAGIIREGGTMLGSARSKAFMTLEGRNEARARL